ncbi:MAG: response regulator [Alphaproteobacteria bacterium]|nr:response regulator [Alphaproteobacteria bacterium]MCB9795146.1 response regulator [Alphaproteobacteria bacterium]
MSAPLPPAGSRFLLVDDDERLRTRMARALRDRGYEVLTASGPPEALTKLDAAPDYAVVDLRMPEGSGLELLAELNARAPGLKVLVLTGYGSIATAVDAVRLGAVNYLTKPADADMLLAAFARGEEPPLSEAPDYEAPSLARAEWEHINRVLEDCAGNVSKAARILGMHRRTLQRKLSTYPPKR